MGSRLCVLSVDIGTTAMKMGVYRESERGLVLSGEFSKEYKINSYNNGLFGDIEPAKWQDAFAAGCRELSRFTAEVDAIAEEKEMTFRRLAGDKIKPLPGALELLKLLKDNGFSMAIASSTPAENIELVTGTLGIADCFQALVTGHDVTEGKPSPRVFLLAAQRLGVEPANCLVIEDAVAGVTAARRAGMACLAVTNTHSRQKLSEANLIVDSLEKVTIDDIKG